MNVRMVSENEGQVVVKGFAKFIFGNRFSTQSSEIAAESDPVSLSEDVIREVEKHAKDLQHSFYCVLDPKVAPGRFCLVDHQGIALEYSVITFSIGELPGDGDFYPHDIHCITPSTEGFPSVEDILEGYCVRVVQEQELCIWRYYFWFRPIEVPQKVSEPPICLSPAFAGYQIQDALTELRRYVSDSPSTILEESANGWWLNANAAVTYFSNKNVGLAFVAAGTGFVHWDEPLLPSDWEIKASNAPLSDAIDYFETDAEIESFLLDYLFFTENPFEIRGQDIRKFILGGGRKYGFESALRDETASKLICSGLVNDGIAIALIPRVGQTIAVRRGI